MKNLFTKIKERLSNESGFTMIELIIVIALIAIIGAMLVPSFAQTTTRAKLKTDINSLKSIQSAINLYQAETNNIISNGTASYTTLVSAKYMEAAPVAQLNGSTYDIISGAAVYIYTNTDYDTYIDGLATPTAPFEADTPNKTVTAKK